MYKKWALHVLVLYTVIAFLCVGGGLTSEFYVRLRNFAQQQNIVKTWKNNKAPSVTQAATGF
jgi:hypothetical protein